MVEHVCLVFGSFVMLLKFNLIVEFDITGCAFVVVVVLLFCVFFCYYFAV